MKKFAQIALLMAAIAPLPVTAQTAQEEEDKGFLTELIEDNLSGVSRDVNIQGFKGALSSAASLDIMTISDTEGVWLTLEDVTLIWNRSALLRGRIEVDELSAARIVVSRAPISETTAPTPEAQPFSLPELPVSIELGSLRIDRIELGPDFLGEDFAASLTGSASLADGEGTAVVEALRLDGKEGQFLIDGSYSNATNILGLKLSLAEGPRGIAARQLDLPGAPSLALTVAGTGPLTEYAADITLATDGQDRISGSVKLLTTDGQSSFAVDVGGDVTPLLVPEYQDFFGNDVALVAEGRTLPDGRLDLTSFDLQAQSIQMTGTALIGAEGWPERFSLRGNITNASGSDAVLLPLTGPKTYVDRVSLAIGYDSNLSEDWSAEFNIAGLDRPGLLIDDLTLSGGGILRPGEGEKIGEVTADFSYAARGLQLDDVGMAEALGNEITGVIQASRVEGAPVQLSRLTLDGPGIELLGEATIAGPAEGFRTQSTILLTVTALERFATLAARDLAGDGTVSIVSAITPLDGLFDLVVTGTTHDLVLDLAQVDPLLRGEGTIALAAERDTEGTRLEALTLETDAVRITAKADLTSGASDATFDAALTDVNLIVPELSGPATLTGNAQRGENLLTDFDVRATGPSATIIAKGTVTPQENGQSISADVTADISDLATYAALTGRDLGGAISANLTGVLLGDGLRFDADLTSTTRDLRLGVAQLDPLLQGTGTLAVALTYPANGKYRVQGLAIDTSALRLRAEANYDANGPSNAEFDFALTNAAQVIEGLTGPVSLRGTAARDAAGQAVVDVTGTGPGTTFALDATLAAVTNEITGMLDASVADLSVYRSLAGMPLNGSIAITANGTALPDLTRFAGTADLSATDLAIGNPSVDPLLAGAGTLTATAAMTDAGLQVEAVNAQFPNVSLIGSLDSNAGAGNGRFDARLRDIGLIAQGISGPATATGTASRATDGTWNVDATATAPGADVDIDATIAADTQEISGVASLAVSDLRPYRTIAGQNIAGGLRANVNGSALPDLSVFDATVAIDTRDMGIGNPTVDQLLRGIGSLNAEVARNVNGLSVRNLALQLPNISVTGALDGTVAGTGRAQFDARLRDVSLFTDQLSGPGTATGTATRDGNGTWQIDMNGTGPGGITANIGGQFSEGGQLNLDIGGRVPLGLANAAIEPRRIDGFAILDLSVNGPPALSSVQGRIGFDGARLSAPTLAISLTDIAGGVTLNGAVAQLDITGQVDSGGSVNLSGPIALEGTLNADIVAQLNAVGLRDPELYETTVNGQITVNGPLSGGARIAGVLALGPAEIQVPSSGVGSLGDLPDVVHLGADGRVLQTIARAGANEVSDGRATGGSGAVFPLDITIRAPSRVFIRGRGLDAELGGELRLGGTTANVIPVGQFDLIRGRIDILQQRFELSEGRASLQGDFVPYIRLVATTESRTGTVINIVVEGPASEPEVTFQSIPDLPQDEVLSQLIFGRNLSEISPLQAVQLAAAVGTLAGRGGGGLIDNFRQDIGLDDFDVTTDDDGNAALRAGKYLSENVYTDVTVGSDGSTEVNINLDVTDEITAKGTLGADGETSIGIFFERDY